MTRRRRGEPPVSASSSDESQAKRRARAPLTDTGSSSSSAAETAPKARFAVPEPVEVPADHEASQEPPMTAAQSVPMTAASTDFSILSDASQVRHTPTPPTIHIQGPQETPEAAPARFNKALITDSSEEEAALSAPQEPQAETPGAGARFSFDLTNMGDMEKQISFQSPEDGSASCWKARRRRQLCRRARAAVARPTSSSRASGRSLRRSPRPSPKSEAVGPTWRMTLTAAATTSLLDSPRVSSSSTKAVLVLICDKGSSR
ncbi:unnamed protein product [Effrenium voratum]|nr:unnamed protein product [Effrenium voratum]